MFNLDLDGILGNRPYIGTIDFLSTRPTIKGGGNHSYTYNNKYLYDQQMEEIAEHILLGGRMTLEYDVIPNIPAADTIKWTGVEVVAGSSVSRQMTGIKSEDVDIYFKDVIDAKAFADLNGVGQLANWNIPHKAQNNRSFGCAWVSYKGLKLNFIWGIPFKDAQDLIYSFDIRAIAIAYDPATETIHAAKGAIRDSLAKEIVWQPSARNISVHRLLKYTAKGFSIEKHQRLIFAELLRSDRYSADLELHTGYG